MIARRSFLAGILAAGAAPAIARAESLMRVAAPRVWVPLFRLVPTDATLAWQEALRTGQAWVQMGVDAVGPGGDITAIALRAGEIGRIDADIRFVESGISASLVREYRDFLGRLPASRSDFLGEVLQREVDLSPRRPGRLDEDLRKTWDRINSADSVRRLKGRW